MKKIITPVFRFTYAHLKQLGDNVVLLIDRDMDEFTDRGFTPEKKSILQTAIKTFGDFLTDEQFSAMRVEAGSRRDLSRAEVEAGGRTMLLAAKNVFGDTSSVYREFGSADLSRQTDAQLVRTMKAMVKVARKYLPNLAVEGITESKISNLELSTDKLDDMIDAQREAINNRDNATEQRAILANELYALIVKYSDTGKDIWANKSEARYNDYVIYNTVSGEKEDETPPPPAI